MCMTVFISIRIGEYADGRTTETTFSWDGASWTELGKMKTRRGGHGCVELHGMVYAVGGWNPVDENLASVEKLNVSTGKWSDGPELPYHAYDVHAVNFMGELYIVGGQGSSGKIVKLNGNNWEIVANSGFYGWRSVFPAQFLNGEQIDCELNNI